VLGQGDIDDHPGHNRPGLIEVNDEFRVIAHPTFVAPKSLGIARARNYMGDRPAVAIAAGLFHARFVFRRLGLFQG
jgi:hypothetical protein